MIYSRNSGPRHVYSKADKMLSTSKVSTLLKLTESTLLALSFILLAGDINPLPGPGNVSDVPTINFKAIGLSVIHLNVRSLLRKMDQLRLLSERNGADIITLSETWLNIDIDDNEIELPGYSITRRDRSERTGGGVMIYIRENLVFNERNDLHNSNEAIWIQVNRIRCKPLIIGCVYRPPNQQVDKFLGDFNNSLAGIESHFDKIILGDFNIDYSSKKGSNANQSDRRKLKGIADLHDMKQIIDLPYLRDNNLLSQKQFGFRLNSSTVAASAMFTDKTLSAMDKGQLTGAVFIDLTKAFDTVNHSILLSKLCSLGVLNASPAYNWFESYLSNRCQVTVCNGTKSSPETVQIGVPQGSILGPLLFKLYINDLPDYLEHCDVTLYADDTVLFISDKSLHNIKSYMNSDLEKLNNWLKLNHLTLSISKSKFMIIASSQRLNKIDSISFKVDNIDLDEVSSFKYLGIVINNRLIGKIMLIKCFLR